jgi:UDP-N-acetylglucosamine 2-epimerase (non-hydrolysing)
MYLHVVVGARPNFIKIAPLVPALLRSGHKVDVIHTGQHYDTFMSDIFFEDLSIPKPARSLGVGAGSHATQTGLSMMRLEKTFCELKPDAVIVVGDVNSTVAAALAASKLHIPIIHLEAGFRSFDRTMPEEINRVVTDSIADVHLVPTKRAEDNLLDENVDANKIHFVGDIMAESLLKNLDEAAKRHAYSRYGLEPRGYILATIHRPENTDCPEAFAEILSAMKDLHFPVLFPVHPRVSVQKTDNVICTGPVGYLDMLSLQMGAAAILTDSGGIQEEACVLHVPCVTVRNNTERVETIELGANRLVTKDKQSILDGVAEAIGFPCVWEIPEKWDSQVSERICHALS